ncbi:MAG: GNAT family N-acetyltransferase [Acholeplasmataceae bacterium]|jgi:ribosomal protein S18 acetylase RimI-like enzyme|nr:GNAT family N-acetyltransferase [Acholeplasmataceae bacterium]
MIERMTRTHPVMQVAQILYRTDDFIFPFLFGKQEMGVKRLSKLLVQDNNSFSYQHIHVAVDKEIVGVLLEHDTHTRNHDFKAFFKAFGFFGLLWLAIKTIILAPLTFRSSKEGRYIQCLCVHPSHRGQGIGSSLLDDAFHRADKEGITTIELDVSIDNKPAQKLYEKFHFISIKTRISWFHRKKQVRMIKHQPFMSS